MTEFGYPSEEKKNHGSHGGNVMSSIVRRLKSIVDSITVATEFSVAPAHSHEADAETRKSVLPDSGEPPPGVSTQSCMIAYGIAKSESLCRY